MLLDDLGYIFGLDLAVPDTFGIDEDGHADRAKADRAAIGQDDLAQRISAFRLFALADAFCLKDALKLGLYLCRVDLRARLAVTYEHVPLDRSFHDRGQLFELFAVLDDLFLCHL